MRMQNAEMEFVTFDARDVIQTSGDPGVAISGATLKSYLNNTGSTTSWTEGGTTYVVYSSPFMSFGTKDEELGNPRYTFNYGAPAGSYDDNVFYHVGTNSVVRKTTPEGKYNNYDVFFSFDGTANSGNDSTQIIKWILANGIVQ